MEVDRNNKRDITFNTTVFPSSLHDENQLKAAPSSQMMEFPSPVVPLRCVYILFPGVLFLWKLSIYHLNGKVTSCNICMTSPTGV